MNETEREMREYDEKGFCPYCGEPCKGTFCSDECYNEYQDELAIIQESIREDLPGEASYSEEPRVDDGYNAPW